jgi:hypothetical protein
MSTLKKEIEHTRASLRGLKSYEAFTGGDIERELMRKLKRLEMLEKLKGNLGGEINNDCTTKQP